jgi:hypothetical protein
MNELESPTAADPFEDALEEARLLIAPHTTAESPWAPLAAAAFFAISAILFASVVIMSPPPRLTPISAVQAPV